MSEGSTATFMGTAHFANNSVRDASLPIWDSENGGYIDFNKRKAAAVHNKVKKQSVINLEGASVRAVRWAFRLNTSSVS